MKSCTEVLLQLIQEGKLQKEAAVSERLKSVNVAVNRQVALFTAP